MSARAGAIIPSCRPRCRSRRCRGDAFWCVRAQARRTAQTCSPPRRPSVAERIGVSSLHVTFLTEDEWTALGAARLPAAHRPAVPLAQRGLRDLRRFPRQARLAQAQGGAQGARAGAERRRSHRAHHRRATSPRSTGTRSSASTWTPAAASGGAPTSTGASSRCSAQTMRDRCLLIMAKRGGRYIAGALNLIGGDCLYGRYWGATEHHPVPALRGLLLPGDRLRDRSMAWRASRPAPRASTSWRAATCRRRPTRRIGSRDPALRRAIARYLQEERAPSPRPSPNSASMVPIARGGT